MKMHRNTFQRVGLFGIKEKSNSNLYIVSKGDAVKAHVIKRRKKV